MINSTIYNKIKKFLPFLFVFIGVLYFGLVNQNWTPEWDSAIYIESARSIVMGKGYTYLGYPQLKYPFGFPLLLSPIVWLWGNNFLLMNLLIVLCALGSIWATYWLFKQFFTKQYSILIAGLTALSYLMVDGSTRVMSGIPYMMCSLLALTFFIRYLRSEKLYRDSILTGMLVVVSVFTRTIGISIFFGFLIYLCVTKDIRFKTKKAILFMLIVILPVTAWNVRNQTVKVDFQNPIWQLTEFIPYYHEYMRFEFDEPMSRQVTPRIMLVRAAKNATYYAGQPSSLILGHKINMTMENLRSFPKPFRLLPLQLLMVVIALFIAVGFGLSFFSRKYLFDYYVICYFGMLFLTTAREPRFLIPIIPFILHYFITGMDYLFKRFYTLTIRRYHVPVSAFFIVYFICSNLLIDVKILTSQHRTPFYNETVQNFMNSIEWVKNNIPKESKIISVRAPWVVLLSGHWCVTFPFVEDHDAKLDFLSKIGAQYLIVSPAPQNRQRYLLPLVKDNPPLFKELYRKGEAKVYQINLNLLREKLNVIRK